MLSRSLTAASALTSPLSSGHRCSSGKNGKRNLLLVLGAASTTGCLLYTIVPATGPLFAFPDFPQHLPPTVVPQWMPSPCAMRSRPCISVGHSYFTGWPGRDRLGCVG